MTQHTLFVCVLCRSSEAELTVKQPAGQALFDRLNEALADNQDEIVLQPVRCMAACQHACALAFSAPNKLTFMLSQVSPIQSVPELLQFSQQYVVAPSGKVPYKERPNLIKQKLYAVLPPLPTGEERSQ
ncbi:MAG: DUF1636 domain-containing protein [Plectolyngbya sp. WJT66-NPBG17]|jgi:predicted metal-binding protein|nr:DUF1636 domain-containing protein [Plectolyngbya sp. WJT66-NPBG17]MBW4525568.1 DUF1636 domain-containing protein [Phormidium tanganyikae FI6-MK23]